MAAFEFHKRRTRRGWYTGLTLVAAALFAVFYVGGASANLSPSTFEGNDGNLVVNTSGFTDWANVAGLNVGIDDKSGSTDNSFGQGTKEDDANVTVVNGSIPPQKSDLTRFYEASELLSNNHVYLYLAWERSNVLGSANMDFEINKHATSGFNGSTTGAITLNRTNGDMLVTYDFGGSGTPVLGLLRWLKVGELNPTIANNTTVFNSNSDCYSANKLPCWGDHIDLTSANSEGAVNTITVSDPIQPSANNPCPSGTVGSVTGPSCPAGTFGEAAIDLTGSHVLDSSNGCDFGQATTYLKSRSSASFPAELKDFIAPVSTPLVPCKGAITVTKEAKNHNCTAAGFAGSTADASCIGDATQAQAGAGFTFYKESNGCTGLQTATVTCHDGGAKDGQSVAADTTAGTGTTALATGGVPPATTCLGNLDLGTYYVSETTTPSGFTTQANQTVSVSTQGDCTSGSAAVNFTGTNADQPLTKLTVNVDSVVAGASNSSVSCVVGTAGAAIGNSPQPATGKADPVRFKADGTSGAPALAPGTYTCTIVIDP